MPSVALATTRPPRSAALPPRVPVEFVGLARQLRRRVVDEERRFVDEVERLVAPLRPRGRFTPVARQVVLEMLGLAWRRRSPLGRLRLVVNYARPRLDIVDLRLADARVYGWSGDDEPALAVVLHHVGIAPPAPTRESVTMIAALGLHALARRFQRGADRSDAAVLADLVELALRAPDAVAAGGEFEVATPNGRWVGATIDGYALVRTYV